MNRSHAVSWKAAALAVMLTATVAARLHADDVNLLLVPKDDITSDLFRMQNCAGDEKLWDQIHKAHAQLDSLKAELAFIQRQRDDLRAEIDKLDDQEGANDAVIEDITDKLTLPKLPDEDRIRLTAELERLQAANGELEKEIKRIFAEDDRLQAQEVEKETDVYTQVQLIDKLTRDLKCSMGVKGKELDQPWQ